jgi:predicted anti-sigma-YlaC factor YlaD
MICDEFRDALDQYLSDSLETAERDAFRGHLRSCATCRDWAVLSDPTMAFSALEPRSPDAIRVEECTHNVLAQIRQDRIARRLRWRRRPWLAAAAIVVAIGAGTVWRFSLTDGITSSAEITGNAGAGIEKQPPPRVRVEMQNEGVRVYQFVEDDDENSAVYFIVNPALES